MLFTIIVIAKYQTYPFLKYKRSVLKNKKRAFVSEATWMLINSINSAAACVSDFRSGRQKQKINASGTKDGSITKAKNNWKNRNNGDLHADNWESEFIKDFYIFISGIRVLSVLFPPWIVRVDHVLFFFVPVNP